MLDVFPVNQFFGNLQRHWTPCGNKISTSPVESPNHHNWFIHFVMVSTLEPTTNFQNFACFPLTSVWLRVLHSISFWPPSLMHSSIRISDVPSPQNFVSLHASSLREMLQMSQRSGRGPQELTPLGLPQRIVFWCILFLAGVSLSGVTSGAVRLVPPAGFCQHLRFININKLEVTLLEICGNILPVCSCLVCISCCFCLFILLQFVIRKILSLVSLHFLLDPCFCFSLSTCSFWSRQRVTLTTTGTV